MLFFSPLYLLFAAPGLLLGLWAMWKTHSTFKRCSRIPARCGLTGAQVAHLVLRDARIESAPGRSEGVGIEAAHGFLSDHYDPSERMLRLSPQVGEGTSLAALAVAAHEAGHAIQHAEGYTWLGLRSKMVPLAQLGSNLAPWVFLAGMLINVFMKSGAVGWYVALGGVILFGAAAAFSLVTLPVEFDASRRALRKLEELRLVAPDEMADTRATLDAAAWTYVAGAVASVGTLIYYALQLAGMRRD